MTDDELYQKDELNGSNDVIRAFFWGIPLALMFGLLAYGLLGVFVEFFQGWNWGIFIAISIPFYPLVVWLQYRQIKKWHTCPKCKESFALEIEAYKDLTRKLHFRDGKCTATGKREVFFVCSKCKEHCSKIKSYRESV